MKRRIAALALAVFAAAGAIAGRKTTADPRFSAKLDKDQQILHALDRLTFGARPGDADAVRHMGLKKWIDRQLHPEGIRENPELEARLAPLDSLAMSALELQQHYPSRQYARAVMNGRAPMPDDPLARKAIEKMIARFQAKQDGNPPPPRTGAAVTGGNRRQNLAVNAPQRLVASDLAEARIYNAVYSNRQLEEELTDFWFNHFNVFLDKGADRYLVGEYERDAIRPHVLGRFRDLLEATAKSPAMLFYLDNWESLGPNSEAAKHGRRNRGLNENYGRELLELHTLGVDGGYTQRDVTEVARCFTGWTLKPPAEGSDFFYNDKWHDQGEKTVLGVVIPAGGGVNDGERVLDLVAKSAATAHHICWQLARKFVADDAPASLVDRMSKEFLRSDGDLRKVMKTMLQSPEFWSQGAYRAKVKTPFEMVVSAVRATGAQVDDAQSLVNEVAKLGEPLYRKLEPTGYSNANSEWVNSGALLERMNFALALAGNKVPGVQVDTAQFGGEPPDEIARKLLARDATAQTRAAIDKADPQMIAGLVIGSPDFQRK